MVDIRNGQEFAGISYPYDGSKFTSATVNGPGGSMVYTGRLGDYPAFHHQPSENGVHSIHVETAAMSLVYKSWNQFTAFLTYHGLDQIVDQHHQRDLPTEQIKEHYFRSAKTWVLVNDSGAMDLSTKVKNITKHPAFVPTGAAFEMLLLDNPYGSASEVRLKLLYNGEPLVGRQTEMFWKGSQQLRLTTITDQNGIATFKLLGEGDYLLNAVHVVKPDQADVDWESRWASITFER